MTFLSYCILQSRLDVSLPNSPDTLGLTPAGAPDPNFDPDWV
jgi:hypothetical protein